MRYLKIILLFALLASPVLGVVGFLAYFNTLETQWNSEKRFAPAEANAMKHAYAAYGVYSALRSLGFSDAQTLAIGWRLGILNELMEQVVFALSPDPLEEVMRDLHNNWVGLTAAQWHWQNQARTAANGAPDGVVLLEALLRSDVLLAAKPLQEEVILPALADDTPTLAARWMLPRREVVSLLTQHSLQRFVAQ